MGPGNKCQYQVDFPDHKALVTLVEKIFQIYVYQYWIDLKFRWTEMDTFLCPFERSHTQAIEKSGSGSGSVPDSRQLCLPWNYGYSCVNADMAQTRGGAYLPWIAGPPLPLRREDSGGGYSI